MNFKTYDITLTNGTVQHTYRKCAMSKEQAIILAQAEAIQEARGYQFVSIKEV